MADPKNRPPQMLAKGAELVRPDGAIVRPSAVVRAGALGPRAFGGGDVVVHPRGPNRDLAMKLGLLPPVPDLAETGADLLARGDVVVDAIESALHAATAMPKHHLRDLRRLMVWAPECFFRIPVVVAYLESSSDETRGGLFRWAQSRGRRDDALTLLSNLLAVAALVRRDAVTAKEACSRVAATRELSGNVSARHLEKTFSEHRAVIDALGRGYFILAEELTEYAWPMSAETEVPVYE